MTSTRAETLTRGPGSCPWRTATSLPSWQTSTRRSALGTRFVHDPFSAYVFLGRCMQWFLFPCRCSFYTTRSRHTDLEHIFQASEHVHATFSQCPRNYDKERSALRRRYISSFLVIMFVNFQTPGVARVALLNGARFLTRFFDISPSQYRFEYCPTTGVQGVRRVFCGPLQAPQHDQVGRPRRHFRRRPPRGAALGAPAAQAEAGGGVRLPEAAREPEGRSADRSQR